jgi:Mannosyl-glycoprotein endo-beta-N-acetylglucosaminidase
MSVLTPEQSKALTEAYNDARQSEHIFPDVAACEVMEETKWGTSRLYVEHNNCFGQKQEKVPVFETVHLPTFEYVHGVKVPSFSAFISFRSKTASYTHRMETLERLRKTFSGYDKALNATDPETFVREVSKDWSTDPKRADNVLSIYHNHRALLKGESPMATSQTPATAAQTPAGAQTLAPVPQDQTVQVLVQQFAPMVLNSIQAAENSAIAFSGPDKKAAVVTSLSEAANVIGMVAPQYRDAALLAASLASALIDPMVAIFNKIGVFHKKA